MGAGSDRGTVNFMHGLPLCAVAAKAQRVRMIGTAAMDLAWPAEGAVDAVVTLSNKVWDVCADVVIAR